ncbi:MAG: alpha-amylase [Candidatus Marinimicrobia bacterium]|nr:alpha-amylase [Candidatus Neomarinimicrobiota bacterium]MCF7830013.1 alpha-amylase [Candidatus Neomarinimicrobiota bacterium]MCF7881945.1 alpha-amylase [Candidatus Neomarinimicrobiota bacterium]
MNYSRPNYELWRELHISREARDKYQFEQTLFAQHGDAIFADFHTVRKFAQRMNDKRNVVEIPEKAVNAGDINGIGLIHEVLHYMIDQFRKQKNSTVFPEALEYLRERIGEKELRKTLERFTDAFPPIKVYRQELSAADYLEKSTESTPHTEVMLEEVILLWLSNINPALSNYLELFDDDDLEKGTKYLEALESLDDFFETQPKFGPENQQLLEMLQAPAKASPHSISGQLEWIRQHWGSILGKYFYRLLRGLDFIEEERKARFIGSGPSQTYDFSGEPDYERFSEDLDWMPKVVLLAKNVYVWLDQLSKKYERDISKLNQIPDEELDILSRWGITGLWLIGLWERSHASKEIKQMMGNPEAVASAYSLYDYVIADELGGEEAYNDLRRRARERSIRMSGDMVPNHVGIDGRWVIEHPDWFVQLDYPPFPGYTFNGKDLSRRDDVGIYLEDHYYERSDAAVVFKRVNHNTGETRFIYHGNDGTSMPWNDTAQLNYLNEEVREAVIQTILHVARKCSIIRFDAAMTLAKKHYQRLWYPQPGTGGDIPSRAEYGMTKEEFDRVFPKEFWREVVDRVAEEEPDTLLLAEAFWLMEGYFVRTLGMHRVYNSAFMHMLKDEENSKYRDTIKNVLEFNPEILKRFVNFMNNPDEETAVAQFGKDDKYFGTCIMMVTMPGLPMIGHGQIEGYTEKYGMEYKRAYRDETPDDHLIQRHEREVFPLMKKRYLFADVENFQLYDLFAPEGHVNENVFAYSNRSGDEKGLVTYNNKFEDAKGWLRTSVGRRTSDGNLVQQSLGEGLHLSNDDSYYCIFRDHITGMEYIRNSKQLHEQGLYIELGAFKYQVFLDFREVYDQDGQYRQLAEYLNGRGVPSVQEALRETMLQPLHEKARPIFNAKLFRTLQKFAADSDKMDSDIPSQLKSHLRGFLKALSEYTGNAEGVERVLPEAMERIKAVLTIGTATEESGADLSKEAAADIERVLTRLEENPDAPTTLLAWALLSRIGGLVAETDIPGRSRTWIDEYLLGQLLADLFRQLEIPADRIDKLVRTVKMLTVAQDWYDTEDGERAEAYRIMESLLKLEDVRYYLGLNRHQNTLWFNDEAFDTLTHWLRLILLTDALSEEAIDRFNSGNDIVRKFEQAKKDSGYKVEQLLEELKREV